VAGLARGQTYFFAVVAYDKDANESAPSNEVSFNVPSLSVVDEETTLTLTNSATSLNLTPSQVIFSLSNAPAGATIDPATGIFTWTPSEVQGPSTNFITIVVTTNGLADLSDTETISVIVNEVNQPPVLPVPADRSITCLATMVVTNTASDPDIPANPLTYQLINPPTGAAIDTQGLITWMPAGQQVGSTNRIQTVVTDYNPWAANAQRLSVTNSFTIVVAAPPVCSAILLTNAGVTMVWSATPGQRYQVQYKNDLNQTNWINLDGSIIATNATAAASDPQRASQQRFYRAILAP
jgi:hypothetical protein